MGGGKWRRARWVTGIAIGGCLVALVAWRVFRPSAGPFAATFDGESTELRHTVVVPTLDTPFAEGKSAVWCASFQLAWNRLKVAAGGPVGVRDAEAVAERLNRAESSEEDLSADSVYAAAGFTRDGIADTIRRKMGRKFPDVALPNFSEDTAAIAYGYLRAAVHYRHPYLVNPEAMRFQARGLREVKVASFGLPKGGGREQAEILFTTLDGNNRQVVEFALDLCKHSTPNQVVLARVARKKTLATTLAAVQEKISQFDGSPKDRALDVNDLLLVPAMRWRILHHFAELEGKEKVLRNRGLDNLYVSAAVQRIEFRLDPEGASVASGAYVQVKSRSPYHLFFDRPFLLYMKKRDAERPFFVMWVANAELLCPYGEG
jgi:hypothetical protein